jgi:LuxR family transcriptional regulator, quorum-sensing system regulator CciR
VTDISRVQNFIDSARQSLDQDQLSDLLHDISAELGFAYFWLVHRVEVAGGDGDGASHPTTKVIALSDYPEAWIQSYVEGNYGAKDPVLRASYESGVGFCWSKIPELIEMTPEQEQVLELGRSVGIDGGFTVPSRTSGLSSGSCNFAKAAGRPVSRSSLLLAELVGIHALDASRMIVERACSQHERRVLTPRQRDCIELVGRGKTDWEIAQILGISPATVKEHVDDARRKYGVGKRVQLVLRAAFEGQIQLSEVM